MEKDLGRMKKNDTTDIVVRIDDFGGKKGLTIREFVKGERYTGFTKSGVRILGENFPAFKEMVNSVTMEDFEGAESENKMGEGGKKSVTPNEQKSLNKTEDLEDY